MLDITYMNTRETHPDPLAQLGEIALGSRLRRLSEYLFREVEIIYKAKGIKFQPRFFPVLAVLAARQTAGVVELAQAMGVTHAAVSQILKPLAKARLIQISADRNDARAKCIKLSAEGQRLVLVLQPIWSKLKEVLTAELRTSAPSLLKMIGELERSFAEVPLSERVLTNRTRKTSIEILYWEPGYKNVFRDLNVYWIEEYFGRVETPDLHVFGNAQNFVEKGGMIFFAKSESTIVGTCLLIKHPKNIFELAKMAVSPIARGKGAGAALLKEAISWAKAQGGSEIFLETSSKLQAANALYKKFGFEEAKDISERTKYARVDRAYRLELA